MRSKSAETTLHPTLHPPFHLLVGVSQLTPVSAPFGTKLSSSPPPLRSSPKTHPTAKPSTCTYAFGFLRESAQWNEKHERPTNRSIHPSALFLSYPDSFPTYSLTDGANSHPTLAKEPLAKTEYSAVSKKPMSRVEYVPNQRLEHLILMKYLKALSRNLRIPSISGVSKINYIKDTLTKKFKF